MRLLLFASTPSTTSLAFVDDSRVAPMPYPPSWSKVPAVYVGEFGRTAYVARRASLA